MDAYRSGSRQADGEDCGRSEECESGICEGPGCGDTGGTCVPVLRPCTADLRQYCGCDGTTFEGSDSCPGDRYEHEGETRFFTKVIAQKMQMLDRKDQPEEPALEVEEAG